jgi:hypothetical protein
MVTLAGSLIALHSENFKKLLRILGKGLSKILQHSWLIKTMLKGTTPNKVENPTENTKWKRFIYGPFQASQLQ